MSSVSCMTTQILPVAMCVDKNILPGLHITLFSTLLHLRKDVHLKVHLYTDSLNSQDVEGLSATCDVANHSYSIEVHRLDLSAFRNLPWHGGWMTYGRIIFPDQASEDRLCFLDADLLVYADLSELLVEDLRGCVIGAASWGSIRQSNDSAFFHRHGFSLDKPYFNAGVLLIDTSAWKKEKITRACFEAIARFGNVLPTMDQTILNLVFYGNFHQIPRRFNTPVTASRSPLPSADLINRVIHLVAHPKPWEFLGFLNGQFCHYRRLARMIASTLPSHKQPLYRKIRYFRGYLKCFPNLVRLLAERREKFE